MQLNLPQNLIDFYQSGRELQYDASQLEPEAFVLKTLEALVLEDAFIYPDENADQTSDPHNGQPGRYVVPVVSLNFPDRHAEFGTLLWVPTENALGTYDEEHDQLYLFSGISWEDIVQNPLPYLNFQWTGGEGIECHGIVAPWLNYRWYVKEADREG